MRYRIINVKAADPNNDKLNYSISYRPLGGKVWVTISDDVAALPYAWDTMTVPDGRYEVKVEVGDAPGNSPGSALTDERVSRPVIVDNTPPVPAEVSAGLDGKTVKLTATLRDVNRLAGASYVVDSGKEAVVLDAVDGIYDSPQEKVAGTIKDLTPGTHVITVRAEDEFGNVCYAAVTVTVAK
jgi:hypothetical protein